MDIKLQKVEQSSLKGLIPVVLCIEALMSSTKELDQKALISKLLDSVAIIGHAVTELNLRRRELIKPDLNQQYATLCSAQVPITGLLFGDNLSQQCREIQETNKLGQKFGHRSGSASSKSDRGKNQRPGAKVYNRPGSSRQGTFNPSRQRTWQRKKPSESQSATSKQSLAQ